MQSWQDGKRLEAAGNLHSTVVSAETGANRCNRPRLSALAFGALRSLFSLYSARAYFPDR